MFILLLIRHNKSENNSKVIIRQTADADEHFFKALRQLKVDVSVRSSLVQNNIFALIEKFSSIWYDISLAYFHCLIASHSLYYSTILGTIFRDNNIFD